MTLARVLTPLLALALTAVLTALGAHVTGQQINHIASYLTAALIGASVVLHGPPAARKVKHAASHLKTRVTRTPKPRPRTAFGLDWAWGHLNPQQLRRLDVGFVCRYLSNDPTKNLSPGESAALRAADITRVVVWESTGMRASGGREAGIRDARAAIEQARACGLPDNGSWAIYFAVDFDAAGPEVAEYFAGAGSIIGVEHTGAYAGYKPISYLFDRQLITYGWQTYAWSADRWDHRAQLLQFSNGHTFDGVAVDFNHATTTNYGGW
jgi:hypothetical protein